MALSFYMSLLVHHTRLLHQAKTGLGKSGVSPYADFVMETDNAVVEILDALDENGFTENTIIFFTTDNGCSPQAKI